MNIFVSPIFALTFATVFIIIGGYCLKCILFYHENRDTINNLGFISKGYKCEEIPQKGFYNGVEYDYIQINRKEG